METGDYDRPRNDCYKGASITIYLYNLESKGSLVRVCPFYPQPKHKHITHLDVSAFWFFQDFRDERERVSDASKKGPYFL